MQRTLANAIGLTRLASSLTAIAILGFAIPASAFSLHNFSWTGSKGYSVSGSFTYDDSNLSDKIDRTKVSAFNISFFKNGELQQSYANLSSLFVLDFNPFTKVLHGMDAGGYSASSGAYWDDAIPVGSLSFVNFDTTHVANKYGAVYMKDTPLSSRLMDTDPDSNNPNPTPNDPPPEVPEPVSVASWLVLSLGGVVWKIRRDRQPDS